MPDISEIIIIFEYDEEWKSVFLVLTVFLIAMSAALVLKLQKTEFGRARLRTRELLFGLVLSFAAHFGFAWYFIDTYPDEVEDVRCESERKVYYLPLVMTEPVSSQLRDENARRRMTCDQVGGAIANDKYAWTVWLTAAIHILLGAIVIFFSTCILGGGLGHMAGKLKEYIHDA